MSGRGRSGRRLRRLRLFRGSEGSGKRLRIRPEVDLSSTEPIPFIRIDMRLVEDTPQSSDWHLWLLGHDRSVDRGAKAANELHMAALLACLGKARRLQPTLDFSEW